MFDGPEEVLERWLEDVNAMKVESIVDLYDDTCTLLPTFSPQTMKSPGDIEEYFRQLSTRKDMSVELHAGTVRTVSEAG